MTAQYGIDSYGINGYGIEDTQSIPATTDLLVQPTSGRYGDNILLASAIGLLLDPSRNDSFSTITTLWSTLAYSATSVLNGGLVVEINNSVLGGYHILLSNDTYVAADVSIEYTILSELSYSPTVANEIIYAGLELLFATGETFIIKRVVYPATHEQQIRAEYRAGGVLMGCASRSTSQSSGKLRLVKFGSVLAAVIDDDSDAIFDTPLVDVSSLSRVRVISSTNGQNEYIGVRYNNYRSNTGVMFGTSPLIRKTLQTSSRILGTIPVSRSPYSSLVDVVAFNHSGQTGRRLDGYLFLEPNQAQLSQNFGMNAHIINDVVLRT